MARVVVVGAGLGGLAAATRLARLGHHVTVLEQADTVGGKLGTFSRDGWTFDTGPSLVTLPAVYRDLFRKTGRPLERELDLVPVDPACHYRFPDGVEVDVPNASRAGVRRAFDEALGPGAGDQWLALLDRAERIWRATRLPFLESPLGPADLLRLSRRVGDLRAVAPWRTLRGLGAEYLHDPRLRMFLDRYATYTGSDPRRAPAALAVVPYVEQTFGAWYVPGGLRRLAEAVLGRAQARGVHVRTGADVTEVLIEGNRAAGVRLADGESVAADVVVANADASHLYRDLVPGPAARRALGRIERATPSLSGFVLLLALRGRTPGLRHHTVLFPQDYDDEFDSVFGHPARPVPDPTVYVSAPDDPALRPSDDTEAWFVLVNAPRHGTDHAPGTVDWTAPGLVESYADRVLAVMAARGLDVRDRLVWREARSPYDLQRQTRAPGGAIYGTSSNGARAAFLRPANRSPVPGLLLVGGSSHPGGGLPLVAMSAVIVADLVGRA
ncbi:MAG TPA: phytoene desaturase family protein [Jiangellales bacterium]|nr:phytoene desaturase family protein [Jiangellales bacterium]